LQNFEQKNSVEEVSPRRRVSPSPRPERWQLTQEAFDGLLAALDADRERAAEKYLSLRRNLVRFFESRGFPADEAADEVCNRLARKTEAGASFENISTYALAVARYLALELGKSPERKIVGEAPEIAVPPFDDDADGREAKLDCLNHCLSELPEENRRLITAYYEGSGREKIENRRKLAEKLEIPQNALRSRAVRLRDKLEACLAKCLRRKI
jgi:RNA polymerase sigma factor (sigma-70 family)